MEAFPLTLSVGAQDDDSIEVHCPPQSLYGSYPGHGDDKWYERGERYTEMSVVVMDLRKDAGVLKGADSPSSGWKSGDAGTGRNESLRDIVERYVKWFLKRDKYGSSKDDSGVKETLEYAYEENEETPSLLLEVRILEAGVTEVPSGMDESGGTLKASVRLHAGVRDMRKGAALYEREFAAKEHLNVEEFRSSGREEAFNSAFCSVIASMRKELRKVSYGEAAAMDASAGAVNGAAVKGSASVASVIEADYPDDVAFWGGALWVAERGERKPGTAGTLLKIDPASMGVIAAIPAGKTPRRVVAGFGSLWVVGGEGGSVVRIDPKRERAVKEIRVGGGVDCVAAGEGGVWAAGAIDNRSGEVTIVKIDPEDEEQTGRIRFAPLTTFTGITAYNGSLWALDGRLNSRSPGRVFRIDPRTNTVKAVIGVGEYSLGMASGEGSLWVVNAGRKRGGSPGTVTRIDASTGKVIATIQAGIYPFAVTSGGGYVWVANMHDETVTKIDPASNRVVDTIPVGKAPARVAFGHGSLWFTSLTDMTLNGVKP